MSKETIEQVRTRKDESAALARKRTEAVRALRETESRSRRDAEALYQKRFELAGLWVARTANPDGEVTQVGKTGFYWKRYDHSVPEFVAWETNDLRKLEVIS